MHVHFGARRKSLRARYAHAYKRAHSFLKPEYLLYFLTRILTNGNFCCPIDDGTANSTTVTASCV